VKNYTASRDVDCLFYDTYTWSIKLRSARVK